MKATTPRRSVISKRDLELLMVLLIRHPEVFDVAKDMLKATHFNELDAGYALVWQIQKDYYLEHESFPDRELMMTHVDSYLESAPEYLTEPEISDLEAFIDLAYDSRQWKKALSAKDKSDYVGWGIKTLKLFMSERIASRLQREIKGSGRIVEDVPDMLHRYAEEAEEAASIGAHEVSITFPEGWDVHGGLDIRPTNIQFIDNFLNGGMAVGEAYGLMGPYASCKTTLAVKLAVEAARRAAAVKADPESEGRHGYSILVSYESRLTNELRHRMLMYGANIHRENLEAMGEAGFSSLSTKDTLRPYEKKKYAKQLAAGRKVKGERERADSLMPLLNNHLIVIDLTGFEPGHRGAGHGYLEEVKLRIKLELRARRVPDSAVDVIILDYVGAMAKNHVNANQIDLNQLRHYVGGAPLASKKILGNAFDCPIWLMHQLDAKGNTLNPTAEMHSGLAAEAKNFAENLDFCLIVGNQDKAGRCIMQSTKHRRTGHVDRAVLQIDGEFNRVRDVSHLYAPHDGKIESIENIESVAAQGDIHEGYTEQDTADTGSMLY